VRVPGRDRYARKEDEICSLSMPHFTLLGSMRAREPLPKCLGPTAAMFACVCSVRPRQRPRCLLLRGSSRGQVASIFTYLVCLKSSIQEPPEPLVSKCSAHMGCARAGPELKMSESSASITNVWEKAKLRRENSTSIPLLVGPLSRQPRGP